MIDRSHELAVEARTGSDPGPWDVPQVEEPLPGGSGGSGPGFLRPLIHDLRSPLLAARTLLDELCAGELTVDERRLVAEVTACLEAVDEAAMRAFALERLDEELAATSVARVDVAEVVRGCVRGTKLPDVPKVDIEDGPHVLIGYESAIEQAVTQLLDNASDHTPLGTAIEVRVSADRRSVVITVEDEGPGVPDDLKERIFAPFERGEANSGRGGIGLGLALVARAAEVHGGRAWVEDRLEGGSSFRMALPRRTRGRRATDVALS